MLMKYFTFSFYIKSSNVPSPREAFLPPNPRNSCISSFCGSLLSDTFVYMPPSLGTA